MARTSYGQDQVSLIGLAQVMPAVTVQCACLRSATTRHAGAKAFHARCR